MYQRIQHFKSKGLTKTEITKETNLNIKTVSKYYHMSEEDFYPYLEALRCRTKAFDSLRDDVLAVYRENGCRRLPKAAVYDYLEEIHGKLPGSERTFRKYIEYLEESEQIEFKKTKRNYTPVPELPFGQQLQIDFGQTRTRSGLKLYIFAAVLSASRYKYCAVQGRPFNTTDLIHHLLDCFTYIDGRPRELVIDQDRVMVVSENKGDIIYTTDFNTFKEEMELEMYVCRKADPESKGKVENLVKFVKNNFFKVRDFDIVEEARDRLFDWLVRRANGKISAATRRIPAELIGEERKHLRSLKASIFQKGQTKYRDTRTVNKMKRISVDASKYPVPVDYKHGKVEIFKTEHQLFVFDVTTGKQIEEHALSLVPGTIVSRRHQNRPRSGCRKKLKAKLLKQSKLPSWKEFVEQNYETYQRYFRDQYGEFMSRMAGEYDSDILEQALQFCLSNKTYSMIDLLDTYRHFLRMSNQEPDRIPEDVVALLSVKKRDHLGAHFQVAKTDPSMYRALLGAAGEEVMS